MIWLRYRLDTFTKTVALAAAPNTLPAHTYAFTRTKTANCGESVCRAAGFKITFNTKPAFSAASISVAAYCPQ